MKKIILLSIMFVGLFTIESSFACSCMQIESAVKNLEQSQSVFIGKVTDIKKNIPIGKYGRSNTITFQVSQGWKGVETSIVKVTTADNGAACGYNFKEGTQYLVYTYGDATDLQVGLCSGTKKASNSQGDIEQFQDAQLSVNTSFKENINHSERNILILFSIVLISILMGKKISMRSKINKKKQAGK